MVVVHSWSSSPPGRISIGTSTHEIYSSTSMFSARCCETRSSTAMRVSSVPTSLYLPFMPMPPAVTADILLLAYFPRSILPHLSADPDPPFIRYKRASSPLLPFGPPNLLRETTAAPFRSSTNPTGLLPGTTSFVSSLSVPFPIPLFTFGEGE